MMADESVSAEHEAQAQREVLDTRAWLNDPASSNDYRAREAVVNRHIAASGTIERARSQREAARQEAADAERLTALLDPNNQETKIHAAIARQNAELRDLPGGHPRNAELVDNIDFLSRQLPQSLEGAITDRDYRAAMTTGGLSDRPAQDAVLDAMTGLGLTPAEKLRASYAIQHSQ